MTDQSRSKAFLVSAVSTVVLAAAATLLMRALAGRAAENLARLAAGESDWERHHQE
jgi:hypothetical protein